MSYYLTPEYQMVTALKHQLRILQEQISSHSGDNALAQSLSLLADAREVKSQLDYLCRSLEEETIIAMEQMGIEEINNPAFHVDLQVTPKRNLIGQQEAAEATLEKIQERAIRSFNKIPEQAVRDITANAFWSVIKYSTVKWSATKLKPLNLSNEVMQSTEAKTKSLKLTKVSK